MVTLTAGQGRYFALLKPNLKMAEYEDYWKMEYESLRTESKDLITEDRYVIRVLKTLDIVSLASCTPTTVGQSQEWAGIVNTAQEDREKLCTILQGKRLL
jgi:hypothetical protein